MMKKGLSDLNATYSKSTVISDQSAAFGEKASEDSALIIRQGRIAAFDRLRVLACVLVLLIHVSAQWTDTAAAQGTAALTFSLGCNMFGFCSLSLFVMLSGALYFSPDHMEKSESLHRMTHRSLHFILLYFIWKLFYLLEDCVLEPQNLAAEGFKKHVILALFQTPGKYHLWYLPMLAVLLFLTPLLYPGVSGISDSPEKALTNQPGVTVGSKSNPAKIIAHSTRRAYLTLFVVLAVLLPTAFQFEFPFKYLLMDFRNLFDLSYFVGYLGYYILGYELWEFCSNTESGRGKKAAIFLTLLSLAAWVAGLIHAVRRTLSGGETFYGFSTPFALHSLLLSAAFFLDFINREKHSRPYSDLPHSGHTNPERRHSDHFHKGHLLSVSGDTFGIYLIHPLILDILTKSGFVGQLISPLWGIPILLAVTFALSLFLAGMLRRIPLIRKLVT